MNALKAGTLGGCAVKDGKTVVVTEESPSMWAARAQALDLGGRVCFYSRPFLMVPTTEEWQQIVETELLAKVRQDGCDLVVIDPIAPFCQGENNASCASSF